MQLEKTNSPIWVDQPDAFQSLLNELSTQPVISVDTESNSLHAYQERVCLMQFSALEHDYLVDPLANLDLSPLKEIFSNSGIEKIFHAAEYDILCLKRDYGFSFINIFDTMISARILGRQNVSLSDLLAEEFGVHLNKHFQKADWAQRPLPVNMRTYAGMDTHYLLPLRTRMISALKTKNLMELANEDFEILCEVEINSIEKPLYLQVKGYHDLEPRRLAVLQELCIYRDHCARAADQPHFKIIGNQALLSVARACPDNLNELQQIQEISSRIIARHDEGLLHAVKRGLQAAPIHKKYPSRPNENYLNRLDKLKRWRKRSGDALGVPSDVVLPRDILEKIAGQKPQSKADLQNLMSSVPWRFNRFGDELLSLIKER